MRTLKRANVILSILLASVIGWIVRIYPYVDYSPLRGRFTPGVDFAAWYTLQTGRLPAALTADTYTGNLVNGTLYLGEFARALLNAPLLLLTGNTSLSGMLGFFAAVPWPGVILLPTVLVLGVHTIRLSSPKVAAPHDTSRVYVFMCALALLGFPSVMAFTSNSGVMDSFGWVMVGLVFYALVKMRTASVNRYKFTALTIVFLFEVSLYHHTTALFLSLMLVGVYLVERRHKQGAPVLRVSLLSLYTIGLVAYVAYLTLSFGGYLASLSSALGNIASGIFGLSQNSALGALATTNDFSLDRVAIRLTDLLLIGLVFAYLALGIMRKQALNDSRLVISGFGVGTVIAGIFVIGWGGFGAFFVRIAPLAGILSILGLAYIVFNEPLPFRRRAVALGVMVILISPVAFFGSQTAQQGTLRWTESSALTWVGLHVDPRTPIMSDSRVASPLIYYGFLSPMGFEDGTSNLSEENRLANLYNDLYHSHNTTQAQQAICIAGSISGTQPQFLIYSDYFAKSDTGVIGFQNSYPPASQQETSILGNVTVFQKVYTSGPVAVYEVSASTLQC